MERRARSDIDRTLAFKSQSRIANYIKGKLSLDQMVSKDRIIKPTERHNKRAYLPHINDDVKIVHRKLKDPKTIEVKIDTRRPIQRTKSRIKEFDPNTNTYKTPENQGQKKNKVYFDLNECCLLINKNGKPALEFNHEKSEDGSTLSGSQLPTPSTQSPCNDLVRVISNVNHIVPDTTYYEETLVTKNDEISMLKEKIRNLQKNIIAKNNAGIEDENTLNKILQSLTQISNFMKILKNTQDDEKIFECVTQIEEEQDKWYAYVATVADGMKTLKELNLTLKNDNSTKATQLHEKQVENERLQKKLENLKQETVSLKIEKNHYIDMLSASKHNLKMTQKENENLQKQIEDHLRLTEKATEQLDMLNKACEKVQIDLQDKEQNAIQLEEKLQRQIAELEAAHSELICKYDQASFEIERLGRESQESTTHKEAEQRYKYELDTVLAAKEGYIEKLQNEADRLREEIQVLKKNMSELAHKNEQNYSLVAQLTNENQTLRDDSKYMNCERKQLNDAISEWCKNESVHDSVNLIDMIDNLKMRMVKAETNYSDRLMENLEQTVKFTHLLNDQ